MDVVQITLTFVPSVIFLEFARLRQMIEYVNILQQNGKKLITS